MVRIYIVDSSAQSRTRIVERITSALTEGSKELHFLPHLDLVPLGIEELPFHAAPDILIIGEEIISSDLSQVGKLRKSLPDAAMLARPSAEWSSLLGIEQLARYGVQDLLSPTLGGREILHKLILLSQRIPKQKGGSLIAVMGGKGGVGITTLTAALGETLLDSGKRVVIVDLDFETQDLARFLHVRPFINEPLENLLRGITPVTESTVKECLTQVWLDDTRLQCMTAPLGGHALFLHGESGIRILLSIFEHLDAQFDAVVVDCGSAHGTLFQMICRIADRVVYVVPNDPAALYASVLRVRGVSEHLSPTATLHCIENKLSPFGVMGGIVRKEFTKAVGEEKVEWWEGEIPLSRRGGRWPGSGGTFVSQGDGKIEKALRALIATLGFQSKSPTPQNISTLSIGERVTRYLRLPAPLWVKEREIFTEVAQSREEMGAQSGTLVVPHENAREEPLVSNVTIV